MLMGSAGVAAEVALETAAVEVNTKKVGEAGAMVEVTDGRVATGRLRAAVAGTCVWAAAGGAVAGSTVGVACGTGVSVGAGFSDVTKFLPAASRVTARIRSKPVKTKESRPRDRLSWRKRKLARRRLAWTARIPKK